MAIRKEIRKGYVALFSVILISAIGVAIMISVIASGVQSMQTDLVVQRAGGAKMMASSCAEEALWVLLETGNASTTGSLTIASGTCMYAITSQSGQNIRVFSTGYSDNTTAKVKVTIATTTPAIVLSSWEEVADF